MIKYILGIVLIIVIAFLFLNRDKKEQDQEPTISDEPSVENIEDGSYSVVLAESSVNWEGRRPLIPNYRDQGTISLESGNFVVSEGKVSQGNLVFDMNSITVVSTGVGAGQSTLQNHLKSDDFFSVANFPKSELSIIEVSRNESGYVVRANLTMKGETNEIVFPVSVSEENGRLKISGTVEVDRTIWGVKFGSGKFFTDMADKVIDDFFTVSFSITAQKG